MLTVFIFILDNEALSKMD